MSDPRQGSPERVAHEIDALRAHRVYKDRDLSLGDTLSRLARTYKRDAGGLGEISQRWQELAPKEIQQVVYGQVVPSVSAPNIAREVVLGTALPRDIEAYSVSRACATSYQSTVSVVQAIETGTIDCGISGGADSSSDVPITVSPKLQKALITLSKARTLRQKLQAFSGVRPGDLLPVPPALTEPSSSEPPSSAMSSTSRQKA